MVRVDEIIATLVIILREDRVQFCSVFAHGASITEEPPTHVQEAGVLHALRAYKEWMSRQDQARFKWVEVRARNALVSLRLRD